MGIHLLTVFLIALAPITELRAAIPVGINIYGLPPVLVVIAAVLGSFLAAVILIPLLNRLTGFVRALHPALDKLADRVFTHTRHHHSHRVTKWGPFALFLISALPIPLAGTWTASLVAYLFGIKYRIALLYIFLGTLIAAAIVTSLSLGARLLS